MEQPIPPQKKDETMSGLLIITGVLVLVIGFVYLLTVQKKSADCIPIYNPDGTVQTGCGGVTVSATPTPFSSVPLLDKLNDDQVSEVDKRLQEAAQELQNKQKAQQQAQQQQQKQIPLLPQ